jgi:hypothetical protein
MDKVSKVTVEVDSKWVDRINSPFFTVIQALTGVSLTFAPLFLYWAGSWGLTGPLKWTIIIVCFGLILIVPGYYIWCASPIILQLRKVKA